MQINLFVKKYSHIRQRPAPPYYGGPDADKILAEVKDTLLTFKALEIIKRNQPVSYSDFVKAMECPAIEANRGLKNAISEAWVVTVELSGLMHYALPAWRAII